MAKKRNGTKRRSKYSADQRKAYYMGYGFGIATKYFDEKRNPDAEIGIITDSRQGLVGVGQRSDLCASMRNGYAVGKKNQFSLHFDGTKKKFPVSMKEYLKD